MELHCEMTPKACDNFIKHCENGYYNGTKFHRSIRNFMVSSHFILIINDYQWIQIYDGSETYMEHMKPSNNITFQATIRQEALTYQHINEIPGIMC